jgi:hypothetical protein
LLQRTHMRCSGAGREVTVKCLAENTGLVNAAADPVSVRAACVCCFVSGFGSMCGGSVNAGPGGGTVGIKAQVNRTVQTYRSASVVRGGQSLEATSAAQPTSGCCWAYATTMRSLCVPPLLSTLEDSPKHKQSQREHTLLCTSTARNLLEYTRIRAAPVRGYPFSFPDSSCTVPIHAPIHDFEP